ncbi:unnamed protein product [Caenorhabditis auriculariae]|uniref:Acyl-CoA thioesterase-like C-terminal domain-containing protein n=1 Tax=Caenorhabditis auriculariae TaxID=2777116 RepID=A0A8S1H164_9PELO|nr:unnamed protein product [Caenorhabditis auriculariae]
MMVCTQQRKPPRVGRTKTGDLRLSTLQTALRWGDNVTNMALPRMFASDRKLFFERVLDVRQDERDKCRSFPPYLNGSLITNPRLFGGQAVSQSYLAAKKFLEKDGLFPVSMEFLFIYPGFVDVELEFVVENRLSNILRLSIVQKSKTIATAIVKCAPSAYQTTSSYEAEVTEFSDPENCEEIPAYLVAKRDKYGTKCDTEMAASDVETRLIEYSTSPSKEENRVVFWARIPEQFHHANSDKDGIGFAVFLTDYFILQPMAKCLNNLGLRLTNATSLQHSVRIFQNSEKATQWFLVRFDLEVVTEGRVFLKAAVFDEKKRLIAAARQEMFCKWVDLKKIKRAKI